MIDIDWAHFDSNIRSAIRILRGFMDPDDVTQECRIRIWEVTKSYDFSLGPYGAYVGRAIHNRALDLRRRAMVAGRRTAADPTIDLMTAGHDCNLVSDMIIAHDIAALPLNSREFDYALGAMQGYSVGEVSNALGLKPASQRRARNKMRDVLSDYIK